MFYAARVLFGALFVNPAHVSLISQADFCDNNLMIEHANYGTCFINQKYCKLYNVKS